MRLFLFVSCVLPLAACASAPRTPRAPIGSLRAVDVHYRAELAPGTPRFHHDPDESARVADQHAARRMGEALPRPEITVRCSFVRLDDRAESELLGHRRPEGRVIARAELEALGDGVEVLTRPTLRVGDGQRAHIVVASQTAFVRAFELSAQGDHYLADPEIGVASEGLMLETTPRFVDGGQKIELELDLVACHLVRPIREISARMPGTPSDVTLQLPIAFDQRLTARLVLAPGEAVLLRGLVDHDGQPIVAFVETERTIAETAAVDR